ncbi:predicted protein, partial [Nematostella vectensis]
MSIFRKGTDSISMNMDRRIADAKRKVLSMHELGYTQSAPRTDIKPLRATQNTRAFTEYIADWKTIEELKIVMNRHTIITILGCCLLLLSASPSYAQDEALTKARVHMLSEEYKEAESIYKKLYRKNPLNKEVYSEYFQLLLKTKDYKRAEKLVTEQLTIRPNYSLTTIDLGILYKEQGKKKKARELFEQAITELSGDDLLTQEVANTFLAMKENELALKTYER